MSDRTIQLQPFNPDPTTPNLEITTWIHRQSKTLSIGYHVQGNLSQIVLPKVEPCINRQDDLWQTTCFEFFLAIFNAPEYWEFNLAPTGNWNIYRFAKYRRGMQPATRFEGLPLQVTESENSYYLETAISLDRVVSGNTTLEIAVTMVIEDTQGNLSYWAISHPGTEADFHRRDGFVLLGE